MVLVNLMIDAAAETDDEECDYETEDDVGGGSSDDKRRRTMMRRTMRWEAIESQTVTVRAGRDLQPDPATEITAMESCLQLSYQGSELRNTLNVSNTQLLYTMY